MNLTLDQSIAIFFSSEQQSHTIFVYLQITGVLIALISLSLRMNMGILGLPSLILQKLWQFTDQILGTEKQYKVFRVYEQNNYHRVIPNAQIYLVDNKNTLLYETHTSITGRALIPLKSLTKLKFPLQLLTYRPGYLGTPISLNKAAYDYDGINIWMIKKEKKTNNLWEFLDWILDFSFIFLIDTVVFISIAFTFFFIKYQGLSNSLIYIVSSATMLFFWAMYIYQIWKLQNNID